MSLLTAKFVEKSHNEIKYFFFSFLKIVLKKTSTPVKRLQKQLSSKNNFPDFSKLIALTLDEKSN